MFKVKVITAGKTREPWLKSALEEYEKRLEGRMQIDWVLLEDDLTEKALKEPNLIALDPGGKSLSSETFSDKLFSSWGARPVFVIGGATGLKGSILKHAKHTVSLSSLTFTHQMVRLILIEQLYRALEIEKGSAYHK